MPHPAPPSATHRVSTTRQAPRGPELPVRRGDQGRRGCLQQVLGCCLLFRESEAVCLGGLRLHPGMDSAVTLFRLFTEQRGGKSQQPCRKVTSTQFTEVDPGRVFGRSIAQESHSHPYNTCPQPRTPTMHQKRRIQETHP